MAAIVLVERCLDFLTTVVSSVAFDATGGATLVRLVVAGAVIPSPVVLSAGGAVSDGVVGATVAVTGAVAFGGGAVGGVFAGAVTTGAAIFGATAGCAFIKEMRCLVQPAKASPQMPMMATVAAMRTGVFLLNDCFLAGRFSDGGGWVLKT